MAGPFFVEPKIPIIIYNRTVSLRYSNSNEFYLGVVGVISYDQSQSKDHPPRISDDSDWWMLTKS